MPAGCDVIARVKQSVVAVLLLSLSVATQPGEGSQRKGQAATSGKKSQPLNPWHLQMTVEGDAVAWASPSALLFLRENNLFRLDFPDKSETLLGKLDFDVAHYPRASNDFAYFRVRRNGKSFDAKIVWSDPFKDPEPVPDIYSGNIFEATGSLTPVLLPAERPGQPRYASHTIQRVWGTELLFDYEPEKPSHDKARKMFPLKARVFDQDGRILNRFEIPAGPWVWRYTIIDSFKNFSCGTDCYVNFKAFMIGDTLFATAFGKAIPEKGIGLFVLEGGAWRRISQHYGRYPLVDASLNKLALSSGAVTAIYSR
jgi:hypothetical protein